MAFFQSAPELPHPFHSDRLLRSYLARALPRDVNAAIEPSLAAMGDVAGGELYRQLLAEQGAVPTHTPWDAWGKRVDHVEITPLWKRCAVLAAEHGLVAAAYERAHGAHSRIHQFALTYLFAPTSAVYTCPLAMTDGAAKTLLATGNQALIERAVPRLTSRDPARAWTSGQWMTERTGGSDVGLSETVAKRNDDGSYALYGTKWFTSAITSEMTLTLARPEGNPAGGKGLALFYVEVRDAQGALNGITVNRLKDKLGTRMVPTAELTLDGTRATLVAATTDGIKNITPMLGVTRTWNAVCAVAGMRHGLSLARDYATRRVQFGARLADKPLHLDTLAGLTAEYEGAFHLAFRCVELMGREEASMLEEHESFLARVLTPLAKLCTAKQAMHVTSEVLECFGGAGYVEDTGFPRMLRDAQVLPIWEGTTNVLSLDVLRAVRDVRCVEAMRGEVNAAQMAARGHATLEPLASAALAAFDRAADWLGRAKDESNARRAALTFARSLELAYLVGHATWSGEARHAHAARRFAQNGVDQMREDTSVEELRTLALEL